MQTYSQTDMTKLVVAFRNFTKTPKKLYECVSFVMEQDVLSAVIMNRLTFHNRPRRKE